jgi:hypothetical protein
MNITPVGQGSQTAQVATTAKVPTFAPAQATTSAPSGKQDTAIISEKAKDLAALKSGKSSQEESKESLAAKIAEGDSD